MTVHDVIVIGGGVAGLYASLRCCQAGLSVITLEADGRWGGRIRTIRNGDDRYEAGAARFHGKHKHMLRLLRRYGLETVALDHRPREYRARTCHQEVNTTSPAYRLISEVVQKSQKYAAAMLRTITFGDLAEIVLGAAGRQTAQNAFGYDGEFDAINAYDGVKMFSHDFDTKETYYVCRDGMDALIGAMVAELGGQPGWEGHLEHRAEGVRQEPDGTFVVTAVRPDGTRARRRARAVIAALPKAGLAGLHAWDPEQARAIDTVAEVPCERIYAKYRAPWFAGSPIVTTDLPVRQFIPITDHVAMVSYSDSKSAEEWNRVAAQGEAELARRLYGELRELFPERPVPSRPVWIDAHHWDAAIHMWRPGVNSGRARRHIQSRLWGEGDAFYVCGEAYSAHQCWVDGALESVEQILPLVRKRLKAQKGGKGLSWKEWVRKKGKLTKADLEELRTLYPQAKWVLFKDRLIDLTVWYSLHPGGPKPYDDHMHQDVYPFFKNIGSHYGPGSRDIKDTVLETIEKYAIATVR